MAPEDIRLSLITYFVNVFMRQHPFFMLWSYSGDLCPKKAVFLVPFLLNSFYLYVMFLCGGHMFQSGLFLFHCSLKPVRMTQFDENEEK